MFEVHGRAGGEPWWRNVEEHMVETENGDGTKFNSEEGWRGAMENARCSGK